MLKKLRSGGPHLITSSADEKEQLFQVECDECGQKLITSSSDAMCSFCGSPLEINADAEPISDIPEVGATLHCHECDKTIKTDYEKDVTSDLTASLFCPACGSENVEELAVMEVPNSDPAPVTEVAAAEEEEKKDEEEDKKEEDEDKKEDIVDDEEEKVEEKLASETVETSDEQVKEQVKPMEFEPDKLEASFLEFPEHSWVLFNNGSPLVRLKSSKVPMEARPLFAKTSFIEMFKSRALETSLQAAVKEFNAEILEPSTSMSAFDMEEMVYENLQATVLPKFINCLALAIAGMAKNVYPDLNLELKETLSDELKTRGVQDAPEAVEAAFEASGTKVFDALVAKAMELYNKPDNVFEELKATIYATTSVRGHKAAEDLEQKEFKTKLVAGTFPLKSAEPLTTTVKAGLVRQNVDDLRTRISLSRK